MRQPLARVWEDSVANPNLCEQDSPELAASALGKLRAAEAVEPLLALLEREPGPQARQYAIKALGDIGDERARATLERIAADSAEVEYNRAAAQSALHQVIRKRTASGGTRS